ncbi:MAG: oligopeptide/dipeptide ABC transporter ATP-binding protein [Nocardioidaceae bacterium]
MSLLSVRDLHKTYGKGRSALPAVRGVSLELDHGETLAIVGESGCGKSSTARVVVGLAEPTSGTVELGGQDMHAGVHDRAMRRRAQMVFQHPDQSLNPHFTVARAVAEPARLLGDAGDLRGRPDDVEARVVAALKTVGLGPEYRNRRPRELSGGQQQRVAIARALICNPDLVVLDEPTASLDQSVRSRVVALLQQLQSEHRVGYLFISHDLTTVRRIAHRVAVMYLGRIVESAPTEELFQTPQHPYTRALLAAAPVPDPRRRQRVVPLEGETPSAQNLPTGCAFQDRCALVHDRCHTAQPQLELSGQAHLVECFAVPTATGTLGERPVLL